MAEPLRQERVSVLIWFHEGLDYFLKPDQRGHQPIRRIVDCRTSVKDLIESCGIPHPEVDLILVDKLRVVFTFRIEIDCITDVYPFSAQRASPGLQTRGVRSFRVGLTAPQPLPPGDYVLRVGARAGPASIPTRDSVRLAIPAAPDAFGALFVRRGQATGNREVPTADLRFRRSEQIKVEILAAGDDTVNARLLDRTGKPLAVPVTAAVRNDADGARPCNRHIRVWCTCGPREWPRG